MPPLKPSVCTAKYAEGFTMLNILRCEVLGLAQVLLGRVKESSWWVYLCTMRYLQGLGFRDITPITEHQMAKTAVNEMKAGFLTRVFRE